MARTFLFENDCPPEISFVSCVVVNFLNLEKAILNVYISIKYNL